MPTPPPRICFRQDGSQHVDRSVCKTADSQKSPRVGQPCSVQVKVMPIPVWSGLERASVDAKGLGWWNKTLTVRNQTAAPPRWCPLDSYQHTQSERKVMSFKDPHFFLTSESFLKMSIGLRESTSAINLSWKKSTPVSVSELYSFVMNHSFFEVPQRDVFSRSRLRQLQFY